MTKPESYPFLRIAKQYSVDYADVLAMADYYTHGGSYDYRIGFPHRGKIDNAILEAVVTQNQVRSGRFSWPSLEPVAR